MQFVPDRKHISMSKTNPNRLMQFGERVAVYCVRTIGNMQTHCVGKMQSSLVL
jgi:hypothetical protein